MLQLAPRPSSTGHGPATVWLLSIKGLDFNPFTPRRPSIPDACETIIGWGPGGLQSKSFDARMRQVLEVCLREFRQHEEEAEDILGGVCLEDDPVVNNQHEEKYYQRIALHLGIIWRLTFVDLDHLRALVMYVVFARIFFIRANLPESLMPADKSVVACDAHILLCRFLRYKLRFGRPEPNILLWSPRQIYVQSRLASKKKDEAIDLENNPTRFRVAFS
ncbi:uncharacterized protein FTOL_12491 [Fusarium torulosum]|uniref:Uncharacterized protein n=1 Tax=Fusarium torulosum TaxID=33205 RepID=A0AAE8MKK5_9HYPO|nr:uncharacterized protein FTOL_12491 [Fusarium torulosum]